MTGFRWDSLGPLPPTSVCRQFILQSSLRNFLKLPSGNSAGITSSCSLSVLLPYSLLFSLGQPSQETTFWWILIHLRVCFWKGLKILLCYYEPFSTLDTFSASRYLEAIVILTVLKLCTHLKVSFPFIPGSSLVPVWVSLPPSLLKIGKSSIYQAHTSSALSPCPKLMGTTHPPITKQGHSSDFFQHKDNLLPQTGDFPK